MSRAPKLTPPFPGSDERRLFEIAKSRMQDTLRMARENLLLATQNLDEASAAVRIAKGEGSNQNRS